MPSKTSKNSKISGFEGERLFIEGRLDLIWNYYQKKNYSREQYPWILATLCFYGKLDEARALLKLYQAGPSDLFFLILAATRKGEYELAHTTIRKLQTFRRKNKTPSNDFFLFQALGFYAHFHGRYRLSLYFTKKSYQSSIFLSNTFWKILAVDLLGHNLIQMGDIHQGLFYLGEANQLAVLIGNKSITSATEISMLTYRAQFSENPSKDIEQIEKALKKLPHTDNYSESLLLLSLTHLQLLIGEMELARKTLLKSQTIIFGQGIGRHRSIWHFETAYMHYLNGNMDLALHSLESSKQTLNPAIDKRLLLKNLGLQYEIMARMDLKHPTLLEEIRQLTRMIGDPHSHNKLARLGLEKFQKTEDPLAFFYDQFSGKDWQHSLPLLTSFGLWGLLKNKISNKQGGLIVVGPWRQGVLLLSSKSVTFIAQGMSELLLKALVLIATHGPISKEQLVKELWHFSYDPLRHDTLIYTLIHRLKNLLGPSGQDLLGEAHHYRFTSTYQVINLVSELKTKRPGLEMSTAVKAGPQLNLRQIEALKQFGQGRHYKVADYAKDFKVTTMTALRDLRELVDNQLITKYGRARATTYAKLGV